MSLNLGEIFRSVTHRFAAHVPSSVLLMAYRAAWTSQAKLSWSVRDCKCANRALYGVVNSCVVNSGVTASTS